MEDEKLIEQLDLELDEFCKIIAEYHISRRHRNGQYFFTIRDNMASQVYKIQKTINKIIGG